ncbi:MAG: recombinase family protein, partial [Chloroflexota bacterium]|nr:recombinase family protein [Chloroflexota bacterium]
MTGATKRAACYVRVSSEEQVEGYSLSAQERAIDAYCAFHGFEVTARYRDEGISARSDDLKKRPSFAAMLIDAEAGRFDAVIVHKLDRFARNLRLTLETLDRLEKAGVGFVSVNENMDFNTPMGRVVLSTMGSLAQFYSDNLSAETKKGKHERRRQGLYNGLLPFGTTKGPHGLPVLDAEPRWCDVATRREIVPAEGLRLAFELAAAGKTDREIAQALTAAGYRTTGNRGMNPFTKDTVCPMLQNRFYVGELPDGAGGWLPGKHGALIDPAHFERARLARERNTRRPRRVAGIRSPWALSGVATCAGCGGSLTSYGQPVNGRRRVQCSGRKQGLGCDAATFYAEAVEAQIEGALGTFAVPAVEQERLVSGWLRRQRADRSTAAERRRLERKLDRLRDAYLDGDLDKGEYQARKADVAAGLAALPAEGDADAVTG